MALNEIRKAIVAGGHKNLHVLSDFDRTLLKAFVGGKKVPSLVSILRNGGYLTPDYAEKAHALFNKYHAIEIDPAIPHEVKKQAMEEWWRTHFKLIVESRLNKRDIERAMESPELELRGQALAFFDFLHHYNIPLVIMSASGLGGDGIEIYLKKYGKLYDNIYIISNSFIWDEKGQVVSVKEPIIHTLNKDKTAIQDFPEAYAAVKNRKNVILLGDSADDIGMIEGFDYKNLFRIGFLNENIGENLELYKNVFDAVLLNDAPMDYVNEFLEEIVA